MGKYIFIVSRIASLFIDYIPYWILFFILSKYGVSGYLISLCFLFMYRYVFTSFLGATPGMMALKLKLKDYDFRICFKREIYRFTTALFFIGALFAIVDPYGRTLYDIVSDTYVVYGKKDDVNLKRHRILNLLAFIVLIVAVLRWGCRFILNDIGLIGLKRVYRSTEYYQSFDGDSLISLSQDELYKKTMGRKYTAVIDVNDKPYLIRISNKRTYTEIYRLNLKKREIVGEYIYKVNMPLQYICSGRFAESLDLCGVTPDNRIMISNSSGQVYGTENITIPNVLNLKCGDIDTDGRDESVVLNRDGQVEIFKYDNNKLSRIYSGKIGEDILPETFYIDKGIYVSGESGDKSVLYFYTYGNNKFTFSSKRYFDVEAISSMTKLDNAILVSNVSRNNMTFQKGRIQRFEGYSTGNKIKRIYNFGSRMGRMYAYYVRSLEDASDIDRDGREEIIVKAVGKQDVQGEGYIVEIYKTNKLGLVLNRILSKIEDILY